jgi:hypothetical protein
MAAAQPLSRLALDAGSVADDLGYVALVDLSHVMGKDVADYRVIGGHTVTILAARWGLGSELYRETGDVATRVRTKDTDIADIWRCLEIAFAAGCTPSDFMRGARPEAAVIVRELFARRQGPGMTALAAEQRLSVQAADQRFTRIKALSTRILGPPTAGSG